MDTIEATSTGCTEAINELFVLRLKVSRLEDVVRDQRKLIQTVEDLAKRQDKMLNDQADTIDEQKKLLEKAKNELLETRKKAMVVGWKNGNAAAKMRQGV